ncbi:glutamate--tRNA ligase [Ketobacter sp. MCCC 1A13808]|uniref:glutamate--tRNA ligase n=1 Tax=Ketobacter sp. MCCC 1A13808 TaxID=2602738 RepID=UPI0012EB6420|nr:glutamate--tRNA ligase [Ketobacter sp. MCCC 1A13808]MVF10628.1 glutamate--tRNA ligase [Ketobacter sp. MCCC 1A13808]
MTVRTRVAPSPTGDPHVGTAYIALFNRVFASQHGGQFILRIEDTDQVRSTAQSEAMILDSLRWLGLEWDEGPDIGGDFGPYRQSERSHLYKEHAERLVASGHAFHCYRTPEELDELRNARKAAGKHSALKPSDLKLEADEIERRKAANAPYVIRMEVPEEGRCEVEDLLRGTIELDWGQVDAQILMKSDGMPTYHLANVVDDHLMQITHVIRGEEWINSAPKHKLLYQFFGWEMPVLCHMPLLRNPDKSKLSKRKNPTSINYYKRMGFLPEAVVNYLGRMGWSMPAEQEKFTLQEMTEQFDIQRVSLGGPVFDTVKLSWLNGLWIRESLTVQQLATKFREWAFNEDYLMQILPQIHSRLEVLSDVAKLADFFVAGLLPVQPEQFEFTKLEPEQVRKVLQFCVWRFETQPDWDKEVIHHSLTVLSVAMGLKLKDFMMPLFVAVSGRTTAPSIMDAMAILGSDMTRARLRFALELLGGASKKETKAWDKQYRVIEF